MYNNFDLSKPFDFNVDPSSTEDPPLCRIIQEGKDPILTIDFNFTTFEPKPWILPTLPENKDTPTERGAAAATDKFTPIIEADSLQPGEYALLDVVHSTSASTRSSLYEIYISTRFANSISQSLFMPRRG